MVLSTKYTKTGEGKEVVEFFNKAIKEAVKNDASLTESFKEDWNMGNGSYFTTTKIANKIWSKQYDDFDKYYKAVNMYTPADLGMPAGAGAYKVPKIANTVAGKLAAGEKVEYVNAAAAEITIETDTYGTGLLINRRAIKRYAPGVIQKLLTSASKGVHRSICSYIANAMVTGAASANTKTGGISIGLIADAQLAVAGATDTNGIKFGFVPNFLVLTSVGRNVLVKTNDWKTIIANWTIRGGQEVKVQPLIYDGMEVVQWELVSVQKGGADVHGMVMVGGDELAAYFAMVYETDMDMFEGRLPGTAGDWEYIFAIDAGYAVLEASACSVMTA